MSIRLAREDERSWIGREKETGNARGTSGKSRNFKSKYISILRLIFTIKNSIVTFKTLQEHENNSSNLIRNFRINFKRYSVTSRTGFLMAWTIVRSMVLSQMRALSENTE